MGQEILTKRQKEVLRIISSEKKLDNFYLAGGTALSAFYFQHRLSDDLDFFSFEKIDSIFIHSFIKQLKEKIGAQEVVFKKIHDRNLFFFTWGSGEELKMEFSEYPFEQFEKPKELGNVKVDSLRDIAAGKLMALISRFDPKDFVDMYFLMQEFDLDKIRNDIEEKFGLKIQKITLGGELAKVKRIDSLPKMFKKLSVEELKDFFTKESKKLGAGIIDFA